MKILKAAMAAALTASVVAAPASAQSAQSLSIQPRAEADAAGASELRGGFIIPLIAIVAIILGIMAFTGDDDDLPHSP